MKKFINKLTPEWWDGWCWFGLGMLVYSLFWAIYGWGSMTSGFQLGMAFYWALYISNRFSDWYRNETISMYRVLNELDNKIIRTQRETIALKNETIRVQNDHIDHLKGQR